MLNKFLSLAGWPALIAIAILITIASLLTSHRWLHRGLWTVAAAVAVIGAINEWRR